MLEELPNDILWEIFIQLERIDFVSLLNCRLMNRKIQKLIDEWFSIQKCTIKIPYGEAHAKRILKRLNDSLPNLQELIIDGPITNSLLPFIGKNIRSLTLENCEEIQWNSSETQDILPSFVSLLSLKLRNYVHIEFPILPPRLKHLCVIGIYKYYQGPALVKEADAKKLPTQLLSLSLASITCEPSFIEALPSKLVHLSVERCPSMRGLPVGLLSLGIPILDLVGPSRISFNQELERCLSPLKSLKEMEIDGCFQHHGGESEWDTVLSIIPPSVRRIYLSSGISLKGIPKHVTECFGGNWIDEIPPSHLKVITCPQTYWCFSKNPFQVDTLKVCTMHKRRLPSNVTYNKLEVFEHTPRVDMGRKFLIEEGLLNERFQ
eukprot:TRINITY_DN6370_c0_g1_i2.p1 TRINITY_DN6370_c0_g1~~TRINITY_DN6370_c0_g1_i2.p1  ORF type:complete len:377 (-),score=41.80 TRINITY_DN6370_c0_g1_i2:51-1181(-)